MHLNQLPFSIVLAAAAAVLLIAGVRVALLVPVVLLLACALMMSVVLHEVAGPAGRQDAKDHTGLGRKSPTRTSAP